MKRGKDGEFAGDLTSGGGKEQQSAWGGEIARLGKCYCLEEIGLSV